MPRNVLYRRKMDPRDYPTGYHSEDLRLAGARSFGQARSTADITQGEVAAELQRQGYIQAAAAPSYRYTKMAAILEGIKAALDAMRLTGQRQIPANQWNALIANALNAARSRYLMAG